MTETVSSLREELREQRAQVEELRAQLHDLTAARAEEAVPVEPGGPVDARPDERARRGPLSRRAAFAAAAGGVAAAVGGVVAAQPAAAAAGGPLVMGADNSAGNAVTVLRSAPGKLGSVLGVVNSAANTTLPLAVYGQVGAQSGLLTHGAAVTGDSQSDAGVQGISRRYVGVYGQSSESNGVVGYSLVESGVFGGSSSGAGVIGQTSTGSGVEATSGSGIGLVAQGGRAPLQLKPASTTGKPTSGTHQVGEVWCDKAGALYVCTVAGKPGTWKKVTVS